MDNSNPKPSSGAAKQVSILIMSLFFERSLRILFALRFQWETTVCVQIFYGEWKEDHFSGFAFVQAVTNVLNPKIMFLSCKVIIFSSASVNCWSRLSLRIVACNTYHGLVYLILPWCYEWICQLLIEYTHKLSNKFATGVEIKVTGDLKPNDSPGYHHFLCALFMTWSLNLSNFFLRAH